MTAVRENGNALKHASESLRKDADVVLTAMGSDGAALEYAHNDLLAHSGVMVVRACVRVGERERKRQRARARVGESSAYGAYARDPLERRSRLSSICLFCCSIFFCTGCR